MPIEVNRVNKQCTRCKNPTIFWNGKNYFCGKCLSDIPKEEIQNVEVVVAVKEESDVIPVQEESLLQTEI
ncbi:MAG: hypothetical protein KGI19_11170 [Thaumarchaeota archaeon]|nr:hypothetical protein [Nitrososphaerota archaeon]MDE1819149.1 hypothetical protein [Nitrososphaerota archaeon]